MSTPTKKKTKKLKPPNSVQVGPVKVAVIHDELDSRRKYMQWDDTDSLGFFSAKHQYIVLDSDLPKDCMADTLVHEVMHAMFFQAGGRAHWDMEEEEKFVSMLSGPLTDTLKRNPELVKYIMTEG